MHHIESGIGAATSILRNDHLLEGDAVGENFLSYFAGAARAFMNSEYAATGFDRVRDAGAVDDEVAPSKGGQYDIRDIMHL